MKGVNRVTIVGSLGQDPETRTFPDGGQITNISVATSEQWKDKQTGEKKERTEWHRVTFNARLAEIAAQYLRKGSKVYIEGSLRTRKYQDKQTGADRYSTDIVAREMQMLDSANGNGQQQAPQAQQPQSPPGYNNQPQGVQNNQAPQNAPASFDDFDDKIPF